MGMMGNTMPRFLSDGGINSGQMAADFSHLEAEDRRAYERIYKDSISGKPSSGYGERGIMNDARNGRITDKQGANRKGMSRNTKAKLWKLAGNVIGTAIGGGALGAALGDVLDPRFRKAAMKTPYRSSSPLPSNGLVRREPLSEPSSADADMEKTLSNRLMDRAEELQVGKGMQDYEDDYKHNRDRRKFLPDMDESENMRNAVRSVLTEALKSIRS